ncbi:MAG: hypothetical protein ACOZIN_05935 [Myxococcota bacterium]
MRFWLWGVAAFACGCASVGPLGRARTLEVGHTEVVAAPSLGVLRAGGMVLPSVVVEAGARRGFTERLEGGVRLWGLPGRGFSTFGGALEGKIQLRRSQTSAKGTDVALATAAGYHQVTLGGAPSRAGVASLTLMLGFNFSERHQLILGPRVVDQLWTSPGANTVNAVLFGASVGFAWRLRPSFTLLPELSLMHSPTTLVQGDQVVKSNGSNLLQLSVGLLFDT